MVNKQGRIRAGLAVAAAIGLALCAPQWAAKAVGQTAHDSAYVVVP